MRTPGVLVYAGTTEGRLLSEILAGAGIPVTVSVATEYGKMVMEEHANGEAAGALQLLQGRLDANGMRELHEKGDFAAVVDATHPFAKDVTASILESLKGTELPYLRLERDTDSGDNLQGNVISCEDAEDCARKLLQHRREHPSQKGRIFLTTGSKDLEVYCRREELKKDLLVRVLPGAESLALCFAQALEGRQIIAMQGPFSKEMNLATIRQFGADCLVTKESGRTGGTDEKLLAAAEAGIPCFLIRAGRNTRQGYTMSEICRRLSEITGTQLRGQVSLALVGAGMGDSRYLTKEAEEAILEADYLFGAPRLLAGLSAGKGRYPYYRKQDILPKLLEIREQNPGPVKAAVLFSGDTGFFSGCEKLYAALREEDYEVRICPGISSLGALSAKCGISWQDANIISCHGTDRTQWMPRILEGARYHKKTFFLTSGPETVREIAGLLEGMQITLHLGYQLSYPEEQIRGGAPEEFRNTELPGLYVGLIENPMPEERLLAPHLTDGEFLRDKVPMTKEEIRHLSVCKLQLHRNAVVYDVGSGTGSVAMEIAALDPSIRVFALEAKEAAAELIRRNREKLGLYNVEQILQCMAPEGFADLPAPTHAFIGGSKGQLKEILEALRRKNPAMRIVMNAISLESIAEMQALLKEYPVCDLEITSVSVARAKQVGGYHLMEGQNPIYIFSFTFAEEC